jgi:hypothetical protein
MTPARRPLPGTCAGSQGVPRHRWRRSGGSCPAAVLSLPSRTSGPARPGAGLRKESDPHDQLGRLRVAGRQSAEVQVGPRDRLCE